VYKRISILSAARWAGALLAIATVGCGSGSGNSSPAAPSPTAQSAPAPGAVSTGARISGTVIRGLAAASVQSASTGTLTVTVSGTNLSSTVDGSGSFTLTGVPSGHVVLQITGPGVQAQVDLGDVTDQETIHITVQVNGSTASVDDDESETPGGEADLEGRVTAVNATGGTLTVGTTVVTVPAGTTIRHGSTNLTLAEIQVGDLVHVKGTRSGSIFTASEIMVQTSNGNPNEPGNGEGNDQNEADLSGTISGLSSTSTCPAISFTVASTKVTTNASTEFKGVSCSQLANGQRVEVKGTKQADSSVLATKVAGETSGN
jgi:hypothetical protein